MSAAFSEGMLVADSPVGFRQARPLLRVETPPEGTHELH